MIQGTQNKPKLHMTTTDDQRLQGVTLVQYFHKLSEISQKIRNVLYGMYKCIQSSTYVHNCTQFFCLWKNCQTMADENSVQQLINNSRSEI